MRRHRSIFGWQHGKRALGVFTFTVGLALLGYVAVQYGMMFREQRRLQVEWKKQVEASQIARVPTPTSAENTLVRLQIPKINLDAIIVEGTRQRQLAVAPGHITGTTAPGDSGNSVITAHRDTFFRHIYELQRGDTILVHRKGKTFTFEVTGKKIVEPDDVSVIGPAKDARLTLITCYPTYYIGPAPERLVVFSKLANSDSVGANSTAVTTAVTASQNSN